MKSINGFNIPVDIRRHFYVYKPSIRRLIDVEITWCVCYDPKKWIDSCHLNQLQSTSEETITCLELTAYHCTKNEVSLKKFCSKTEDLFVFTDQIHEGKLNFTEAYLKSMTVLFCFCFVIVCLNFRRKLYHRYL